MDFKHCPVKASHAVPFLFKWRGSSSLRDRIEVSSFYATSRPRGVLSKLAPQGCSLPLLGVRGVGGIITGPSLPLSTLSLPQGLTPGSPGLFSSLPAGSFHLNGLCGHFSGLSPLTFLPSALLGHHYVFPYQYQWGSNILTMLGCWLLLICSQFPNHSSSWDLSLNLHN